MKWVARAALCVGFVLAGCDFDAALATYCERTGRCDGGADAGGDAGFDAGLDAGADGGHPGLDGGCTSSADCAWNLTCGGGGVPGLCAKDVAFCSSDGLCWELPTPQGNDLKGVWAASADDAWAVGATGTILKWDGTRWYRVRSPVTVDLYGVWGSAADDVWIVGDRGARLHFDGGSLSGGLGSLAFGFNLRSVWGADAGDVWAVGAACGVMRYDGATWSLPPAPPCGDDLASVTGSANTVFIGGGNGLGSERRSLLQWSGSGWTTLVQANNQPPVTSLLFDGTSLTYATRVGVFRGLPGSIGDAGVQVLPWPARSLAAGWGTFSAVAVGDNNLVAAELSDGGWVTLRDTNAGVVHTLRSVGPAGPGALAVGDVGYLLAIDLDGGTSSRWSGIPSGVDTTQLQLRALHADDDADVFAVWGTTGFSSRQTDASWRHSQVLGYNAMALWSDGAGLYATAGSSAFFYRPSFSGNFQLNFVGPLPYTVGFTAVWGRSSTEVYLAGSDGSDGGGGIYEGAMTASTFMPVGTPRQVYDLHGTTTGRVYAVARGGRIDSKAPGGVWTLEDTVGVELGAVVAVSGDEAWAAGAAGALFRRSDAGWTPVDAGTSLSLRRLWASGPGDVWAVGDQGAVLHFDGTRWSTLEASTRVNLRAVSGLDGGPLWVGGGPGCILRRTVH